MLTADFPRSVAAEVLKLKRTPVLWLSLAGGVMGAVIVFLMFFILIEEFVGLNENPWKDYYQISHGVLTMFLLIPYIVLMTSSVVQQEHNSHAWKYLFSLPVKKGTIYYSKLLVVVVLVAVALLVFWTSSLLGGYLLGVLKPAYGFLEYPAGEGQWLVLMGRTFVASLGLIALQYWFSVRWKNYIIPISIGMVGFIFSVLIVGEESLATYFPYCYPMFLAERFEYAEILQAENRSGMMTVEWISLVLFLILSVLGFFERKIRDVK